MKNEAKIKNICYAILSAVNETKALVENNGKGLHEIEIKKVADVCFEVHQKFNKIAHDSFRSEEGDDLYAEGVCDGITIAVAKFMGCDVSDIENRFGLWEEDPDVPEAYSIEKKDGDKNDV